MAKLSEAYRKRAQRAARTPRQVYLQESRIVRKVGKAAVQSQLYDVTTLRTTKRMLRSIQIRYLPNGFGLVFDGGIAPHAGRRVEMKGTSKTGGHRLDMNPRAYIRRNAWPVIWALRRKGLREIAGGGVTSTNGR